MKKFLTLTLTLALLGSASFVEAATTPKKEECQDNNKVVAKGQEKPACVGAVTGASAAAPAAGIGGVLGSSGLVVAGLAAAGFILVLGSGSSTTTVSTGN
jgi:hypothetical protein